MSDARKKARMEVEIFCQDKKGKYFLCPDGNPRRLDDSFVIDDTIHLNFEPVRGGESPMVYRWPVADFDNHWKPFQGISQQQAIGKTALDSSANNALAKQAQAIATVPAMPTVPTIPNPAPQPQPPAMLDFLAGVDQFIDPDGHLKIVASGLMEAFRKIQTTPTYEPQARVQVDIGKQVIDIVKTRVMAAKVAIDAQRITP